MGDKEKADQNFLLEGIIHADLVNAVSPPTPKRSLLKNMAVD